MSDRSMALSTARAGVPTGLSRDASQAEPLIANAWWEQDPEFIEYLDDMERQDNDREA